MPVNDVRAVRDYDGDTRLIVVWAVCPLGCAYRASGATPLATRLGMDEHFAHAHPEAPSVVLDATECYRKSRH